MRRWWWTGAAAAALTVIGLSAGEARAATAGAAPSQQLYVSASAGSDPTCATASQANPFRTIAGALACAHSGAQVNIGAGQFAGEVTVPVNATLVGSGPGTVISDPTVASDLKPEVTVPAGRSVTVRNLVIDGGDASGNALHGGIRSTAGILTVRNVDIRNTIAQGGAGIDAESSTGVMHVTVQNSTISNGFGLQIGGGIYVYPTMSATATLSVVNSTITGNQASSDGGGLAVRAGTTATVRESTITDNSSNTGGGIYVQPEFSSATMTLAGTLVAGNTAVNSNYGPDCLAAGSAAPLVSGGYNLIGENTGTNGSGCSGFTNNVNGDQLGAPGSPINPGVGPLADNGGPTPTQALLSGSPAIGTGNVADCAAAPIGNFDQRGVSRRAGARSACDIGAYDTAGTPLQTLWVSHSATTIPTCAAATQTNPFPTIASALACARNGVTVRIGAGQFAGEATVPVNATLVGAGAKTLIADPAVAADLVPELTVAPGRTVTVESLRIDGADTSGNPAHGGIALSTGALTVQNVDINRTVLHNGSGIDAESSSGDMHVTVRNSTIRNGLGLQNAGAIVMYPTGTSNATLTLLNSTLSGNQSNSLGGAVAMYGGTSFVSRESTIANNTSYQGGGIYLQLTSGHSASLTGTLLAGNTALNSNNGPDCFVGSPTGLSMLSGGGNLIGQNTGSNGSGCTGFVNGVNGDQVGTSAAPINPMLAPLANNGGTAMTQALLSGSPAIGAGNAADCQVAPINNLDERGAPRNAATRHACDVGAYDTGA